MPCLSQLNVYRDHQIVANVYNLMSVNIETYFKTQPEILEICDKSQSFLMTYRMTAK